MYDALSDVGGELLDIVAYTFGTLALSGVGLAAEYNGLQQFLGGHRFLAGWFAVMGLVVLGFAWNLGRDRLLPRLAERLDS